MRCERSHASDAVPDQLSDLGFADACDEGQMIVGPPPVRRNDGAIDKFRSARPVRDRQDRRQ